MNCSVPGCDRPGIARELCTMHYQRLTKTGALGGADPLPRTGELNSNWKGGRGRAGQDGKYVYAHAPDHPAANRHGQVLEHRLVMERHLGRPLTPDEIVHHRNEDTTDNRIENLEVMTQAEHARLHFTKAGSSCR